MSRGLAGIRGRLRGLLTHSIRRQLMLGIALVHAVLMTIFVFDLVERARHFLQNQSVEQAISLAETLAANSTSWVLANDVIGLEEVIQSQAKYPGLRYAMVLSPESRVLGHTETDNTGLYAIDEVSRSLLSAERHNQTLINDGELVDAAAPVVANKELIGWARVGLGQGNIARALSKVSRDGIIYTLLAIAAGTLFAFLMARGLTGGLARLVELAERVRQGERHIQASLNREDEIARLGKDLNEMVNAIAQTEAKLAEREQRLKFALEGSNDGLWDWNVQTDVAYFSPRFETMLDYEPGELEGHIRTWDRVVHPQDASQLVQALAAHLKGNTPFFESEHRVRTKNGQWIWVLVRGKVVARDDNGTPLRAVGTQSNITERKEAETGLQRAREELERRVAERTMELLEVNRHLRAQIAERERIEQELRQAKESAEKANQEKSRFLAAANHDLRQPLQTLGVLNSVLAAQTEEPPIVEIIGDQGKALASMRDLLDVLLDIEKLETGAVEPKIRDFAIAELLSRQYTEFKPMAQRKGLELSYVPCGMTVHSDFGLLERVIQNFLSNAIRYTERGRVLLGCRRRGSMLRIEVWDTGVGIPAEQIDSIFEQFYQLGNPARDRSRGLGLGLAIVERIARLLGYHIDVRSKACKGSVFAIEVPVSKPWALRPATETRAPSTATTLPAANVLLIEDDPAVAQATQMYLELCGLQVRVAESANAVLDQLTHGMQPDLIITDYRLPHGQTGTHIVQRLRLSLGEEVPAIVVTGDTSPEIQTEARGMNCHIFFKPMDVDKLTVLIGQLLASPDSAQVQASQRATDSEHRTRDLVSP